MCSAAHAFTVEERPLFHDLLRLPILHHYVWSELMGHNSLQKIVYHDPQTPAKNYLYVPYSNLYCGVSVIYCHCQIQLLSESSRLVS